MGGINPPVPSSSFSLESVKLSMFVSLARSSFESSNVSFEELITFELTKNTVGDPKKIISALKSSTLSIINAVDSIKRHTDKMDLVDFEDYPECCEVSKEQNIIGQEFIEKGLVDANSWDLLHSVFKDSYYKDALLFVRDELQKILEDTEALISIFQELSTSEIVIYKVMDQNLCNSPKQCYAKLYTSWSNIQGVLLAMSLFLSEVWYRHNGHSSLVQKELV